MKKLYLIFSILFFSPFVSFAISGACSSHNGVNCSMGRQLDGKVYCNDGWTESVVDYEFMVACKNYKYSCNLEEWNSISQKYNLESLFFQLQNLINNSDSGYFFQTQYNVKNSQYNTALTLAERDCEAIGADRADQQNYQKMQSDFYSTQIKNEQDKLTQLEQEKQKLTENYLNELKSLNNCPANYTLSGTSCLCNDGYTYNGSACITYTQNCQTKYGPNSYGDKSSCTCTIGYVIYNNQCISGTEYCRLNYGDHIYADQTKCVCESGYVWNPSQNTCGKVEAEPTQSLPTSIKLPIEISKPLEEEQRTQTTPIIKKQESEIIINKAIATTSSEEIKNNNISTSSSQINTNNDTKKQNEPGVLNKIKSFFKKLKFW